MPEVTLLRQLESSDVKCPAGSLIGDASVRCNIEEHTLNGYLEPSAVEGFCCGEYTACSTWRAMKKVEDKGGDFRKILRGMQDEAVRQRSAKALREARLRAAQRLLHDDTPEGKAFRRKLAVGEFAGLAPIVAERMAAGTSEAEG